MIHSRPTPTANTDSLLLRIGIHLLPLISAYCYTWFLGENNPWLRAAQSLGWFMVSLAIKRAYIDRKRAPENILWALASFVMFLAIQNITKVFDPTAIIAIIIYSLGCIFLQINTIATLPDANPVRIAGHSAIAGAMFYFLLEEYIFLDGLWFWIAVATSCAICMSAIKKYSVIKKTT